LANETGKRYSCGKCGSEFLVVVSRCLKSSELSDCKYGFEGFYKCLINLVGDTNATGVGPLFYVLRQGKGLFNVAI
jgi:hypothetical protein